MSKRRKTKRDPVWTPFETAVLPDIPQAKISPPDEVWLNSIYQVSVYHMQGHLGVVDHLSIKRRDRRVIRDWRHLQRIKNELCGPEREGVEIFPAESRLVDTANQYHLFVLPEGVPVGFGFDQRLVSEDPGLDGAKQRPWDDDARPDDLVGAEEINEQVEKKIREQTEGENGREKSTG